MHRSHSKISINSDSSQSHHRHHYYSHKHHKADHISDRSMVDNSRSRSEHRSEKSYDSRSHYEDNTLQSTFKNMSTSGPPSRQSFVFPNSVKYPLLIKEKPVIEGQSYDLTGNYFKLSFAQNINIYHYDVELSQSGSEKDSAIDFNEQQCRIDKFLKRNANSILKAFEKENESIFSGTSLVYDGWKNLYTSTLLKIGKAFEYDLKYEERPNHSEVPPTKIRLSLVQNYNLNIIDDYFSQKIDDFPQQLIPILNVIFRNVLVNHYSFFNGSYFNYENYSTANEIKFLEMINGCQISIRMAQIGMCLVVRPRVTCMFSRKMHRLLDLVLTIDNSRDPRDIRNFDRINSMIRGLLIYTKHSKDNHRTYSIHSLIRETPDQKVFLNKEGQKMTIYNYFKETYPELRINPDYPLIRTKRKDIYLPLELCFLEPKQFLFDEKVTPEIHSALLRKSEFKPAQFFQVIHSYVDHIISLKSPLLEEYGIQIHPHPARFDGYQLSQPKIVGRNPFSITQSGKPLDWGMIVFDDGLRTRDVNRFLEILNENARKMDINLGERRLVRCFSLRHLEDIENNLKIFKEARVKLLFAVFPENHSLNSSRIYNTTETLATQTFNMTIQGLRGSRVRNPPRGYFDNLLFEINGKMGGNNSIIDPDFIKKMLPSIKFSETMIIGIDVNHPGLKENVKISIAAAVGSYDQDFSKYGYAFSVQKRNKMELIENLDRLIQELLANYTKQNRKIPKTIIVFRDGVSEGQFNTVKQIELVKVRELLKKYQPKKTIKLVWIIVQKRHHTRFVTTKPHTDGRDLTQNVPSGTVVDNSIVEPTFDIFYINSHFSRLGTSKPTKFIVLANDLQLSNAEFHRLCFYACFNCVRLRCPLSLPTPVFYADLCAYKTKIHLMVNLEQRDFVSPNKDQDDEQEKILLENYQKFIRIQTETHDSFFYL